MPVSGDVYCLLGPLEQRKLAEAETRLSPVQKCITNQDKLTRTYPPPHGMDSIDYQPDRAIKQYSPTQPSLSFHVLFDKGVLFKIEFKYHKLSLVRYFAYNQPQ